MKKPLSLNRTEGFFYGKYFLYFVRRDG